MHAKDVEPHYVKKKTINDGKQSAGHDGVASDVNDAFRSMSPFIVVGERVASDGAPLDVQAQAAFSKVSGLE
eukprot:9468087-Karenia_brevis.AAC.1